MAHIYKKRCRVLAKGGWGEKNGVLEVVDDRPCGSCDPHCAEHLARCVKRLRYNFQSKDGVLSGQWEASFLLSTDVIRGGRGGGLRGGERTSLVIWQRGGLVQNRGHMDLMNFLQKNFFRILFIWKDRLRKRSIPGSHDFFYASVDG